LLLNLSRAHQDRHDRELAGIRCATKDKDKEKDKDKDKD
jgi:hypothetical protein